MTEADDGARANAEEDGKHDGCSDATAWQPQPEDDEYAESEDHDVEASVLVSQQIRLAASTLPAVPDVKARDTEGKIPVPFDMSQCRSTSSFFPPMANYGTFNGN